MGTSLCTMDWETRTARAARAATNQSNDQSGHKGFACNALRMGWMRHFRASAHIKPTSCTLGNPGQMQQFIIGVYALGIILNRRGSLWCMCSERVHAGNFPFTNLAYTLHCTLCSALQCGRFVRGDFLAWGSVLAGGLYKSIYLDKSGDINHQCFYYFHRRSTTRDCCGTSGKPSGPDKPGCAIRLCSTWDNQSNYI